MDTLLLMTVGSLVTLVGAVAGWGAFLAYHAGRLVAERRHRDELATLRIEQRLRNEHAAEAVPFVDLADEFGLVNADGHSCCWCGDPDVPCVIEPAEVTP